jgi:uncharacterized iron-regulated protein
MKLLLSLFSVLLLLQWPYSEIPTPPLEAFVLYDSAGKKQAFAEVTTELAKADVVLFGELHNNALLHWLQLQTLKALHEEKGLDLVMGLEMLETDVQLIVNEYMSDQISEKHFISEARAWPNYKTDYAPLVNYMKESGLHVYATNTPRRYANLVSREGILKLSQLQPEAQNFLPPLPIEIDTTLPAYAALAEMMSFHGGGMKASNMVQAQALKDATMAHFILKNRTNKQLFLHLNGSFHSNNFEGVYHFLKKAKPNLNVITINSVEQTALDSLAEVNRGSANYIFVLPADMTKTY